MKRALIIFMALILCQSFNVVFSKGTSAKSKPLIAIIVDDAGTRGGYYKLLFNLPEKVTVAIIPATVRAKEIECGV